MRQISILLTILLFYSSVFSQRDYKTHTRSMLRQTIYNTGEIGRALEASKSTTVGVAEGTSSWEWPPNSKQTIFDIPYWGHQNSFGSGILFRAKIIDTMITRACGGITDGAGNATAIAGVYCNPGTIVRIENYPVLSDGSLNPSYNPDEAEEKIITTYTTTDPMKLTITQTSRAWSYPGYDAFIIIEYDIVNNDVVDYTDGFVMFENAIISSAFGMQRKYEVWDESGVTTRSREIYARYNFTRYLSYVHTRDGFPDKQYFNDWSTEGNRGGLNSPQAPGVMILHYDYEHLQLKSQTTTYAQSDTARVWDENGKFRQPYYIQQIANRNQDINRCIPYFDMTSARSFGSFNLISGQTDSTNWANYFYPYYSVDPVTNQNLMKYWNGRHKPRALSSSGYTITSLHYTSFGPYVFPVGQHLKFTIAQCVGYGPGTAQDTVYRDAGGAVNETGYVTGWYKPVPSWYDSLTYPGMTTITSNYMGSAYLKNHSLPWYVAGKISNTDVSPVVSLRDVADRAIQMYTGNPLVKYDGVQFKPESTPATGVYNTIKIPVPAPVISVETEYDSNKVTKGNRISWGTQIESFSVVRLNAPFSHYKVYKATDQLGPWILLDSVAKMDPRYYKDAKYSIIDTDSRIGESYYYSVISVNEQGGKSGMTNIVYYQTQFNIAGIRPSDFYRSPSNEGALCDYYLNNLYNYEYFIPRNLSWGAKHNLTPYRYWFQVATDISFSNLIFNDSSFQYSATIDSIYLDEYMNSKNAYRPLNFANGKYFWRYAMIEKEPYGVSLWSNVWSFTVTSSIPVEWFNYNLGGNAVYADSSSIIKVNNRNIRESDAVGVFFPRNDSLIIAGFGYYYLDSEYKVFFDIRSDNPATLFKEGFSEGDTLIFKIWDAYEGKEYYAQALTGESVPIFKMDSAVFLTSLISTYAVSVNKDEINKIIPNEFILNQNYPNPFNPSTVINYQLPVTSRISLKIYDVLGREVTTLVNEEKSAGKYEVKWNADKMASGVYIYRLTAGEFIKTRKMLLLR